VVALPPGRNIHDLKRLYDGSQVAGETLPSWLEGEDRLELLQACQIGTDTGGWKSIVVVGPIYHALIRLDPAAKLDLASRKLWLPRFGQVLDLTVKPEHLEP
jgi:hypothetical protein